MPDFPIWGGQKADTLYGYSGKAKSERNIIHGGAGNDRLIPGSLSYDLWGDAGKDTVELPKNAKDLKVIDSSGDGTMVEVSVKIGKKTSIYTLNYVETLKIGKKTYKTSDL